MKKLVTLYHHMVQSIRAALKSKNTETGTTPPVSYNTIVERIKTLSPEERQQQIQNWLQTPSGQEYAKQMKTQYLDQMFVEMTQNYQKTLNDPKHLPERLVSSLALNQLVELEKQQVIPS